MNPTGEKERTRAGSTAVPLLHSVSQLSDRRLARAERDATDLEELERSAPPPPPPHTHTHAHTHALRCGVKRVPCIPS